MGELAVRFGAILHPVRIHPVTKQPDRGPLRHTEHFPSGGYSESFDMYQQISAENYAREAAGLHGKPAMSAEAEGERKYAFTDDDATAVRARLASDTTLTELDAAVAALEDQLAAAQEQAEARRRSVVQGYHAEHAGRIEEVPYKYDAKERPEPAPPKPAKQPPPPDTGLVRHSRAVRWLRMLRGEF